MALNLARAHTQTGKLRDDVERAVGTNKEGMVAWRLTLKTPEYPEGRDVVVIANDVTVQSGSFGVKEVNVGRCL
jgi:hypothetical protein